MRFAQAQRPTTLRIPAWSAEELDEFLVRYNMNGNVDGYLIEGSEISRWDLASQSWVQQGPVIDVSGKTKSC